MPLEDIDGRVILLILFVVISAVKWLMEKIKGPPPAEHEISESLEELYDEFRDEIRQRQTRTIEPQPARVPPPLPPEQPAVSAAAQHRKPPPLTATTGPRKVQLSSEQKAAAARFEQLGQVKRRPTAQSYVRKLLSSPQSTRQAIILAEILGKPKSLRDA